MYCVYLTVYSGNLLPPFYIGSSSVKKVTNGYHGTVKSKKYKNLYHKELKDYPHLFKTHIISVFNKRQEALEKENILQRKLKVIESPLYFNEAYARNFGMSTKGNKNGFFGKHHSEETLIKMRKPKSTTINMKKPKSYSHRMSISKAVRKRKFFNDGIKDYMIEPDDPKVKELKLVPGRLYIQNQNKIRWSK
jgi:FtsZ-interacting cell division protein YlmF